MTDLEIAKNELYEENLTLAIVKNGALILLHQEPPNQRFLRRHRQMRSKTLQGASLADRVVGKAVALLCAYAKIKEVYACRSEQKSPSNLQAKQDSLPLERTCRQRFGHNKNGYVPF